jgi:hypothetical protein
MLQQLQLAGSDVPAPVTWSGTRVHVAGWVHGLRRWAAQRVCGATGHEEFVWHGEARMALRCGVCGNESQGWRLIERPPVPRYAGDPSRHAIDRASLGLPLASPPSRRTSLVAAGDARRPTPIAEGRARAGATVVRMREVS